jgi:two-component system, sensor histidine kinase and response regulator
MKQLIANSLNKSTNILIVDDDIEQLAEMVSWLEHRKGNLYQARSGEQATKILQNQWIDAVITDWQLPEMSGIDLIAYLREEHFKGPLLLCTGMMLSPQHLQEAFDTGANDYLRKPMNKVELNARLASALQLYQQREALTKLNQSQERFINLLSQDIGDNLHHLHQVQRLDSDPLKEQALTRRMGAEFQKMMSWARYRFGVQGIQPQWFELKNLIDALADNFSAHWHRVTVRNIKNMSIYSDPDTVQRILYELLDNAFKYSEGNITLKAKKDDQMLTLSVCDAGEFISEGALERLNQPTHQGLGLTICSDLLSLLDSQLKIRQSRKGESIFLFELRHI